MYGTTTAAAGAVLLRGTQARKRSAPSLAAANGGFTLTQAGAQASGTGSVTLTLGTASRSGTLLIATVLSTAASGAFTAPAGWRLAQAVSCTAGRAEIWYYPGTPPAPGNPGGVVSATFAASSGANCRGAMSEFALPDGTMPVFDATGQAVGTGGGSFSLTSASGNVAGDLGIAMVADFFSASVGTGGTWTAPSGWADLRHLGNGAADPWAGWYRASLAGGAQSLSAGFSYTTGENGWAFAFAAIRAVTFQPIWLNGGEMTTMVALDPTGQELIMGGDVEGLWRTADFGDHWQPSQDGLSGANWRCTACVAWSLLETGTVYACVGKSGGDGGFLVSTDGGVSWSMRSTQVQFRGGAAGTPPRPGGATGEPQDADRSVGDLLVQDPAGGFLYTATYNGGIARSSAAAPPAGTSWEVAGLSETGFYPRTLVMNPANSDELWAGTWDSDGTGHFGGVWHCTTARTATSTSAWTQTAGFPAGSADVHGTVADLKIIGGYLYAACPTLGVFRHQIGTSTGWLSLNGGPVSVPGDDSGQWWTSLDGFVDSSGNHQVFAACGKGVQANGDPQHTNVVLITITPAGSVSYSDLTGKASIELAALPPDGQGWWRNGSGFTYWLGGGAFVNPHVLSDPNDRGRLYVTGAGGFFRTGNALAAPSQVSWTIAVSGAPMSAANLIAADPGASHHVIVAGSDFVQTDLTDPTGWDTSKVRGAGGTLPVSGVESHAVAFGPDANIYTGVNTKYGQNAGGNVYWRAVSDTTFTWHDTGYGGVVSGGNAPIGLFAGTDSTGVYLAVVAQGAGVYRAIPVNLSQANGWTWQQVNGVIGTSGQVAQHCPIVAGNGAGYLYCFDRPNGVWRSADFGKTWTLIWSVTSVTDGRSGWLAVNPAVTGELWASTNDGLYKLTGAGSGTVGNGITLTKMNSTYFPDGAGGIVFNSGTPYAVSLNGGAQPSAALLTSADGGTTWTDAGGPSVGSYASWPGCLALTGAGLILLASDQDVGIYGTPVA